MITLYNRLLEATDSNDKPKNIFLPPTVADLANRVKQYIAIIANKLKKQGVLNADGSYDFEGNVDISNLGLKSIAELGIKFGKVGRDFDCGYNQLTSLVGVPREVGRVFWCSYNKVKFSKADVRKVSKVKGEIIT